MKKPLPKRYRIAKMRRALAALAVPMPDPDGLHLLARLHLNEAARHLEAVKDRAKKKNRIEGVPMSQSDLPSELGSYSDGVTDDAAFHPEIIGGVGCSCPPSVSGGLGDLAVAGIPSYLLSRKNLSNPVVRRRIAAAIERMTPKMKRRVLGRLRSAVSVARVSGAVRGAYPSIAGAHPSPSVGWSGITVSGSRGGCPYANVAGPLTP